MSNNLHNNFFEGFPVKIIFAPAHFQSAVPDSFLHFFARQTLAFMATNGLEFDCDRLADVYPKIWVIGSEKVNFPYPGFIKKGEGERKFLDKELDIILYMI